MSVPRRLGSADEDRAARYLIDQGYTIVTRRYKAPSGELDLVVLDGDQIVFVEVKSRSSSDAEHGFDPAKAERLRSAAAEYLVAMGEPKREGRFDLVVIRAGELEHHRGVL